MNPDAKYWVALSTHRKIKAQTFTRLHLKFKILKNVWQASERELTEAGLELGQIKAVKEVITKKNPDQEIEKLKKQQIEVIILPDKDYPKLLYEIADPPGLLYLKGRILPQDELAIAVVGSRKYTAYGERATEEIVLPLARAKITIISGLASGIDAVAHQKALEAKGRTMAVLACGFDQIYPRANIRLADKILASDGAIISEFPLGRPALTGNFPLRNRIIAGLSLGTVVVEATENSGSLLTATAAIDYNREVFAVPGEIFKETSQWTNRLIKMGAKLITCYQDILDELAIEEQGKFHKARKVIGDTKEEEILLKLLRKPILIDTLVIRSGLKAAMVNSTLIQLEIKGKVQNLGGTRYVVRGKL
mgnify:CR=1 FL=1